MAIGEEHVSPVTTPPVRWGMGDAIAGNVVVMLSSFVFATVIVVLFGEGWFDGTDLRRVALLQVPLWVGLLGAPLVATHLKGRRSLSLDFGLRMRWIDIPLGLVAGVALQFVLGILVTVVYDVLGIDVEQVGESARELTAGAQDVVGVLLLTLVVVVAAPILEELFYRGLWLRAAERRMGEPAALIFTSVLFATIHFQLYDFPALFGVGLALAAITARTGRLGPAIWAHVGFNATTVVNLLVLVP